MPRATTAAWLVMPPRAVRMPSAACMPWMSSGLVSMRTRITVSPVALRALSAVVGVEHDLARGRAGRGRQARGQRRRLGAFGSSVGCSSWSSAAGSMRSDRLLVRRSGLRSTMSTAILSAALAVRLPVRVCSIQSLPCCTVNSMSCMSR